MNKLTAPPPSMPAQGPLGSPVARAMPPQAPPAPPTKDQIVEGIQKAHYLNDGLRLLLNKPGGASRSDVIDEAGHLIAEGVLSPQQAAQQLQSLPDDNGEIQVWLKNHIMNSAITRGKLLQMLAPQGQGGAQQQQTPQGAPMPQAAVSNALTAGAPQGG